MKDLTVLESNIVGGIDAIYKGMPYTLTSSEVAAARSGAWGFVSPISPDNIDRMQDRIEKVERSWRDFELKKADVELFKVQDGEGTGLVSDWRKYRKLLRDWPEDDGFPNKDYRPQFTNTDD